MGTTNPCAQVDPPDDRAEPVETVDEIDMEFAQPPVDTTVSAPLNVAGRSTPATEG